MSMAGPSQPPFCSLRKNTAFDVFGPYADETMLSCIDRVLFLLGVDNVKRFFEMMCSDRKSGASSYRPCSANGRYRSVSDVVVDNKSMLSPSRTARICGCCCPKCTRRRAALLSARSGCTAANRCINSPTLHQSVKANYSLKKLVTETAANEACFKLPTPGQLLKRSLSLCSSACRKLKQITCPNDSENKPTWCWTRLSVRDGCQICEVFRNIDGGICSKRPQADAVPDLIFVVLPNGIVMPFETIKSH